MKATWSYILLVLVVSCFSINAAWSQVHGIEGTWYFGEKPMNIEIYDDGWRFDITDDLGSKSQGKAFNEKVIYWPEENISGQLEHHGTIIVWSDGTYWAREPFTGDEPPGMHE